MCILAWMKENNKPTKTSTAALNIKCDFLQKDSA